MDEPPPTLKEATHIGNELVETINTTSNSLMDVDDQNSLDQIHLANKFVADIDESIRKIHKAVRSSYSKRFPELPLTDPMSYLLTVQLLGNRPDRVTDEHLKNQLNVFLDSKMQLLVTMTAATTQGVKLEPKEMENVMKACAVAIQLTSLRAKLVKFVELNMTQMAPNLSAIVGASIAARLLGLAGGLVELSTMPACNIPLLGSTKLSNIETTMNGPTRVGLIYDCDLIQQIPFDHTKDVRKRALRWVSNKCVLAARCDISHSDLEGKAGQSFRDKILSLINKELEPPPKKAPRPLPAPIEKSGKKRGGKRVRRLKERYAQTELRKAANRMNFGEIGDDAYQNDLGFAKSQLSAIQKLRGPQVNEKTKIRLSKGAQKKLAKEQAQAQAQGKPGVSSITFTPEQQGLEIYNPKAAESYSGGTTGESSKYFSSTAGFFNLNKQK